MLAAASLKIDQVYGHYDGTVYDEQKSPRLIIIGSKRGNKPDGIQ
jgi:hypothetical protein